MRRAWPVGLCTYMWCVVFVAVCMHVHAYGVYATCVCLYVLTSADVCAHRTEGCLQLQVRILGLSFFLCFFFVYFLLFFFFLYSFFFFFFVQ